MRLCLALTLVAAAVVGCGNSGPSSITCTIDGETETFRYCEQILLRYGLATSSQEALDLRACHDSGCIEQVDMKTCLVGGEQKDYLNCFQVSLMHSNATTAADAETYLACLVSECSGLPCIVGTDLYMTCGEVREARHGETDAWKLELLDGCIARASCGS